LASPLGDLASEIPAFPSGTAALLRRRAHGSTPPPQAPCRVWPSSRIRRLTGCRRPLAAAGASGSPRQPSRGDRQ
jgi:hypothetical protein